MAAEFDYYGIPLPAVAPLPPAVRGIVSGSTDRTANLKLWSWQDGACTATLKGHTRRVTAVAQVGQGSSRIASGSDDSTARVRHGLQNSRVNDVGRLLSARH
jgi:WD40 repeat protein